MVAGVAWQVVSLGIFALLCAEFGLRVRRARNDDLDPRFREVRTAKNFKAFHFALGFASLAIFIRSIFRCVELSEGFDGKLANDEVTYMILEGAMVVIAVGLLTAFHPGFAFGGMWNSATWTLRGRKNARGVGMKQKIPEALELQEREDRTIY